MNFTYEFILKEASKVKMENLWKIKN